MNTHYPSQIQSDVGTIVPTLLKRQPTFHVRWAKVTNALVVALYEQHTAKLPPAGQLDDARTPTSIDGDMSSGINTGTIGRGMENHTT